MRRRALALLVTVQTALLTASCNDRTRDPVIRFEPPVEVDAGSDAAGDPVSEPDELCEGVADGTRCELPNATGVCAGQRCRLVACETGFDDCEDEPGCETDLSDPNSCGSCGSVCQTGQRCDRAELTFVCTAGIVCALDRYDLDSDPDNGCEVVAEWGPPQTLVPPDLEVEAVGADGETLLLAGSTPDGARVSAALPVDPYVFTATPTDPANARAIERSGTELRVLWTDGLSRRSDTEETFETLTCADGLPRQYVGLSEDFVATNNELTRVDGDRLTPVFGWGEYLAAFYPHEGADPRWRFDASEVSGCAPCHFDGVTGAPARPIECVGTRQCRTQDFDDALCEGCAPSGTECPDFDLVGLSAANDRLFVLTARGGVVLDPATITPIARAESLDTTTTLGGPRFVGGDALPLADGRSLLLLYHSAGFVRGLFVSSEGEGSPVDIAPAFPDFDPGVDLGAEAHGASSDLFATLDGGAARVFAPGTSTRSAWLTMETAPQIQGLRPVAVVGGSEIRILYLAAGQAYLRTVKRDVTSR